MRWVDVIEDRGRRGARRGGICRGEQQIVRWVGEILGEGNVVDVGVVGMVMEGIAIDAPVVFNVEHGFEGRERGDLVVVVENRGISRVGEMGVGVVFGPGSRVFFLAIFFHPQDVPSSGKHDEMMMMMMRGGVVSKEFLGNGKRNGGKLTERDNCSEMGRKTRERELKKEMEN